jgi:NADPH-dependent glutamate synthase beta subunit-like oxidoreductase/Pyruvate/2-oxoacid:ferredoxin oxidoreductase delta subunit
MQPVDVRQLGQASLTIGLPDPPPENGRRIAVIGGGPAGLSVAWQLRQKGYKAVVYDTNDGLGGKLTQLIPESRIPREIVVSEMERVRKIIPHVGLEERLTRKDVERLQAENDFVVIAAGAVRPRMLPVPGKERMIPANDFLARAKKGEVTPGERVVVIGAGNVGCDAAVEAGRLGARSLILIDVQKPLSFGKEREAAEAAGAVFRWPCFTKEITEEGVVLQSGEVIPADTVILSIGDVPDTDFLPESVDTERGFVRVDENFRTSDDKIFAVGDIVKPGLLTDAIGAGRKAAAAIDAVFNNAKPEPVEKAVIDPNRMTLAYFDPRITRFGDLSGCGAECASCGVCRDCGTCIALCPRQAISRVEIDSPDGFELHIEAELCIGCGFCAGVCPCGVWDLVENPLVE